MPELPAKAETVDIVAIAVGNSRVRIGHFTRGDLIDPASMDLGDADQIAEYAQSALDAGHGESVILASVNESASREILAALADRGVSAVYSMGTDLAVPIRHTLRDDKAIGVDRLLCAFAAYARAEQACVVVDAGSAITVDFVDGEGTFQGGAIGPGVRMMLAALHEKTSALPEIESIDEPGEDQGKNTTEAMVLGVLEFARGGVHRLIERYALAYGAYPQIVATGGDAALLFRDDEVIEHVVSDLQLMGIHGAAAGVLVGDGD